MSLRELVVGSTQMLVESVLRRINENLLDYFINLPESIWLSGFLDQVNLKDVMFNTKALSNEWYSLDIPFRLKYGHIRRANIQVLLAHSKLVMEVDGVVLIIGPNISNKSYEEVIKNTMDNVFGLLELFKSIITIKNNNYGACNNIGSNKEEMPVDISPNVKTSNKEGLNSLLRWLFRYVPDLSLSVRNIYIRYEDDVLDASHPMSAGIHINSLTINPARSCWDIEWPTERDENVKFVSKETEAEIKIQSHPLAITNVDFDARGIFGVKVKGLCAYWDDESAPFIPISLLEQTELSNDKFGVFSAITIDDMQNLVDSNLKYHTRIISNMSMSAQFGFVNPLLNNRSACEKDKTTNTGFDGGGVLLPSSPMSSSFRSNLEDKNTCLEYSDGTNVGDFSIGPNIATLININVHSGFEINIYPQMVHGLVRLITLYNQFQFWTQIRRFRPVERPGSGDNKIEVRKACREWWIFSLKYYKNMLNKDSKHTSNLKDEIDYRIERKKYIKIIKKWKWLEYMITGTNAHNDSGSLNTLKRPWMKSKNGALNIKTNNTGVTDSSILFDDININSHNLNLNSNKNSSIGIVSGGSNLIQIESEMSHLIGGKKLNLSRYWEYSVDFLRKISKKSDDVKFILGVLQHHTYWTITQWHILAEREYNLEFELLQNNVNYTKKKNTSKSNDCLTLLAYGLHCQPESNMWDLINKLRKSYEDVKKYIINSLSVKNKDVIPINTNVFNQKINGDININAKLLSEKIEINHPYIIFSRMDNVDLSYDTLTDFFGSCINENKSKMNKKDWHSIRLRLHLWGKFYDEYLEAFPLSITETIEIKKLIFLSYYLNFQQMDKLFSASLLGDSLNLLNLISYHDGNKSNGILSQIDNFDISLGNNSNNMVTMARPKNQQTYLPEKDNSNHINISYDTNNGITNNFNIDAINISKYNNDEVVSDENLNEDEKKEEKEKDSGNNSNNLNFKYEKNLPNVYNENKNIPEWLSDIAGPGISLPKLLSNRIVRVCIPRFEINICHLVKSNKDNKKNLKLCTNLVNKSNECTSTISYIPRKLFGLVISNLGFNMNTCTSLRISCCFKKLEVVVWNYNDSNLIGEFISSIKLDKTVGKKMIKDDQIVIFSICDPRIENNNNKVIGEKVSETPVRGNTSSSNYSSTNMESIEVMSESSPTIIHHIDDANLALNSDKSMNTEKSVRFETNITSRTIENNSIDNSMNVYNSSNMNKYLKKWNYFSLVLLPPNNSAVKEKYKSKEDKSDNSISKPNETYSNFVFKIPFYLKLDFNLTSLILILNEQLLDNIRAEIMKLLQVYLLTTWSQYKGFGSFPVSDKIRYIISDNIYLNTNIDTKVKNNFELLLCHPFNLYLNKSNVIDKFNRAEWNKIDSLLNKIHVRISVRLPSVEIYMLNESIDYFNGYYNIGNEHNSDTEIDKRLLSFDLSTSSKLLIESQTILIGTLLDKLRGNMNRIYFRGFQMKFDTQQNITSIIKIYLRFKNLIFDRYRNLIGIMNLFKDDKFDYISKHSLACFTDEILRLQCEKLPDTNNILLKEFSLSINNNYNNEVITDNLDLNASDSVSIELKKRDGSIDSNNNKNDNINVIIDTEDNNISSNEIKTIVNAPFIEDNESTAFQEIDDTFEVNNNKLSMEDNSLTKNTSFEYKTASNTNKETVCIVNNTSNDNISIKNPSSYVMDGYLLDNKTYSSEVRKSSKLISCNGIDYNKNIMVGKNANNINDIAANVDNITLNNINKNVEKSGFKANGYTILGKQSNRKKKPTVSLRTGLNFNN
ncbi:VPS13 like protein involved in vacuolar protein trafficking [Cryptosporidium ryanae]|uniref:VPS13 like protein involved in vacuolar protein trafficking n=1 Tax=Cryptosporidium ryanae TaxID=515981 RepID=UPI00351A8B96|nr:VPS13 like protein involved in vacuolar protein trafficking [Cryptosporidium ryanae]